MFQDEATMQERMRVSRGDSSPCTTGNFISFDVIPRIDIPRLHSTIGGFAEATEVDRDQGVADGSDPCFRS